MPIRIVWSVCVQCGNLYILPDCACWAYFKALAAEAKEPTHA